MSFKEDDSHNIDVIIIDRINEITNSRPIESIIIEEELKEESSPDGRSVDIM